MTITCLQHFLNNVVKIPVTFKYFGVIVRFYSTLRKGHVAARLYVGYRQVCLTALQKLSLRKSWQGKWLVEEGCSGPKKSGGNKTLIMV